MTRFLVVCSLIFLGMAAAAQTLAAGPETTAALQATNYIRSLQNADGGFPDFGSGSSTSGTLEAVFAFSASGIDARTVENGGNGPDDYLAAQIPGQTLSPGTVAKLVAGLAAMDVDATSFSGINALATMEANYDTATGKYGDDVFAQSLFILAEAALDRPVPAAAAEYLQSLRLAGGGWEFCCSWGADTNSTALALRALVAAGVPAGDADIAEAIAYLHSSQQADGGFPYSAPGSSDPNSTAYVIQAIIAVGQSAETGGVWDLGGTANPLHALVGFQNPATGALQYFGSDSAFATYQGVPGLMLSAFPEASDPDDYTPTPTTTSTSSSTATVTPTNTPTSTTGSPSQTSTKTPTRSATPTAGNSPTTAPTLAATTVNTVLAATAVPTRAGIALGLPQTGSGSGAGRSPAAAVALAISGASLMAAGVVAVQRRRTE